MNKDELNTLISVSNGTKKADLVIRNAQIVDVYSGRIISGDIAVVGDRIAGIGRYEGVTTIDASGRFAAPGFIDSHIHIESSYLTPETFGAMVVPHGTSCIVADPHEITNVCGIAGFDYMVNASKNTALDVRFMVPSCVPATPFEHSGARLDADDIEGPLSRLETLGLAEFMNAVGVINMDDNVLSKLSVAEKLHKPIDGHSPGISGNGLNAYIGAGISTDHECSTIEEMNERISRGMYVLLRHGSACHDLENLLPGVTPANSRRCLLCSDDRHIRTIFEEGHIDSLLRYCVAAGIDPVDAVRMATLNPAECYGLHDQGGIAPGKRADIVLLDNLVNFGVTDVWIAGQKCAENGKYLLPVNRYDISSVSSSVNVQNFSEERLKLRLSSDHVKTIDIKPGGVLTGIGDAYIKRDDTGDFIYDPSQDIVKVAVVERHHNTGNVAVGLLHGYGIKNGAVALSIAHDSHNIIVTGTSDKDMAAAVEEIIRMRGGIALVQDGKPIHSIPLPVAGLMTDADPMSLDRMLMDAHRIAFQQLGVSKETEPLMTLCFMSLPVIPDIKITDMGLFDVTKFEFTSVEV